MVKQVSVSEAHAQQQEGATYVDVRSTVEFNSGHPAGAINVPLFEPDEDTGQMTPNADFVRVMQATFPPDTRMLVGCQAGGRSMRAAQVLESFGFTDVANVRGGFGGGMGDAGWVTSGLPVDTSASTYDALLDKADSEA